MTRVEPQSQTWRVIDKTVNEIIDDLQRNLEAQGLDAAKTENLRGRIAALRDILTLADVTPDIPFVDTL